MNEEQSYFTPSGLYLWGINKGGNIVIKKSSYNKALVDIHDKYPNKNPDTILEGFLDYWQSDILKIKDSKFSSPTTIWKYKKIWKDVGLMI